MTTSTTLDINAMVAELDQRSTSSEEKWDLYRCHDGRWIVNMTAAHERSGDRTASGPTIAEALTAALASPRLPTVPPRPHAPSALTVERAPDRPTWVVCERGSSIMFGLKTKREATAAAERFTAQQVAARDEWDRAYGPIVATGTEGVDYRMSDR